MLDFERGRAATLVDNLDAVKQAVYKALQTERFAYLIYNADYGAELSGLTGKSSGIVESELRRRIRETLLQDDRISDVVNFAIAFGGDSATATFTVISIFGSIQGEVTANV
nr:DUF2634 domain-containing protein [Cohnella thailandensis]